MYPLLNSTKDSISGEEKSKIKEEHDNHLKEASNQYQLKKEGKNKACGDPTHKVLMIDLEKCQPTPVLYNSQSFYSLKLWAFNYTIHDASSNKSYCCMWDESIAGRGSNEMASCLMKWLQAVYFKHH